MERLEAGEKVALLYSVNNNYQMFGILAINHHRN
jgi:hypothetical protein